MTTFSSRDEHRRFLAEQARMPRGFRAATTAVPFLVRETGGQARMNLTLLVPDQATARFAAVFTRNAFAGAPVLVGRRRLAQPELGAIVINNKISNVGTARGVEACEAVCAAVGRALARPADSVMAASTGVIGWRLPEDELCAAVPAAVDVLSADSLLPAAQGIMTTDLYPKVRRAELGGGTIVGIAKGAGMIEPNMATMLGFVLTDLAVPREALREMLPRICERSFNAISIDSDTSTSDMVIAMSSGHVPCPDLAAFEAALTTVCQGLAHDIVRNGEGVHHVLEVAVTGAPDDRIARALGKAVVNSPLVKTAICGNDANVGRLLAAIGKFAGNTGLPLDLARLRVALAGQPIFADGAFHATPALERQLALHLEQAQLYASRADDKGHFAPPIDYPPHERRVDIAVELGLGPGRATVLGADLSHEYISENADYRS